MDLRRGYEASDPLRQVNDSNKGSNGPAGSRSGKLNGGGLVSAAGEGEVVSKEVGEEERGAQG